MPRTSTMRPSTSTAPVSVVAGLGSAYPLPRSQATGESHRGTSSSAAAPWPKESLQRSERPAPSTSPPHAEAESSLPPPSSTPRPLRPIAAASSSFFKVTQRPAGAAGQRGRFSDPASTEQRYAGASRPSSKRSRRRTRLDLHPPDRRLCPPISAAFPRE